MAVSLERLYSIFIRTEMVEEHISNTPLFGYLFVPFTVLTFLFFRVKQSPQVFERTHFNLNQISTILLAAGKSAIPLTQNVKVFLGLLTT